MKRRLFVVPLLIVLSIFLVIGATVFAGPRIQDGDEPPTPPAVPEENPLPGLLPLGTEGQAVEPAGVSAAWKNQVTRPGVYVFYDFRNVNPADYPGLFNGGHMTFYWNQIEKSYHVYDWSVVDSWIANEAALGKPVALEIVAYVGASSYDTAIKGYVAPGWLPTITCTDSDGRQFKIPRYHYSTFQSEYRALINAFGAKYNNDSRVEFIEISTGVDGENQPVQYNSGNVLEACIQADGLGQYQWEMYMKNISDYYLAAFPSKPRVIQHYPMYLHDSERRTIAQYDGPKGIGFKGNGLKPDRDKATRRDDPASNFYLAFVDDPAISYSNTVPIGFETYQFYLTEPILQYWAVLNALDKHADYLVMDQDTFTDGNPIRQESLRFAMRYLGKNVNNTPEVWVALRETGYTYYPQYGNYSFYLYQDNGVPGGSTKAVTYRPSGSGEYQIQNTLVEPNVSFLAGTKEGWIARRTNQATGNPYMWFKVDDGYLYGGTNAISITVTYFDRGTDTWSLEYDGPGGVMKSAGTVTKTNTNTWKKFTFYIDDARMANGLLGLSDFRINCNGDGDEYIHMVMLAKRSSSQVVHNVALQTGPNLVSFPVQPASTAIQDVLAPIAGKYTKVFAYDNATKSWKSYDVSVPSWANTLQNLDPSMGFWIYMNQPATLPVTGTLPSSTSIPLYTGANLVGFPRANSQPIADALASIDGKYTKVFEYDAGTSSWRSYDVSIPSWANTLQELRPGYGYWIYVNQNCTLTVSN